MPLRLVSVLLSFWLGVLSLGFASPSAWGEAAGPFRYHRLGAAEGLAQSSVYALLQDHRGFIWLGTQDGLHRYDGYQFEIFRPQAYDPSSLPHGMVQALLEDRQNRIWVGTFKGLARLDGRERGFERPLGDDPHNVQALLEDQHGDVWVGTRGSGLFRFSAKSGTWKNFRAGAGGLALTGDDVFCLYEARDGSIYLGGSGSLSRLRSDRESFEVLWSDPAAFPVRSVREDSAGRLWVGVEGAGVLRFEPGRLEPRRFRHLATDPASLGDDQVTTVFEDRERRIWIGSLAGGLDLYRESGDGFDHLRHDESRLDSLCILHQ